MIVRLGDLARVGARDPRVVIGPYVELLLAPAGLRPARTGVSTRRTASATRLVALGVDGPRHGRRGRSGTRLRITGRLGARLVLAIFPGPGPHRLAA